jgi:hypothetical protein
LKNVKNQKKLLLHQLLLGKPPLMRQAWQQHQPLPEPRLVEDTLAEAEPLLVNLKP